jgi:serine/threonine protein kinase
MKPNTILVNRYQIREQLSQKNGRRTFLAQDLQSQDLVIIKVLRFDADFEWDDHKLFEREATTLQHLDRPAIPKYLDYFDLDEPGSRGFALVQTYIDAPSLATVVETGRKFSEAEVVEFADRILTILTYLHEQLPPVIHRDIKPSNILLGNRSGNSIGDVYLVDFGSVQTAASKDGGTITIVGSYGYMPLEQFGGQTTPASDLYSLGMTIIYLLTGTHPAELVTVKGQVNFTAEISNQFRRWLEKMTQPHLDERFNSAKLAQIALTSEDDSYANFAHLKPANTKVQLYRDREKIEIRFPNKYSATVSILLLGFSCLFFLSLPFCFFNMFTIVALLLSYISAMVFADRIIYPIRVISIDRSQNNIRIGKSNQESEKIEWIVSSPNNNCEILVYSPGYVFDRYLDVNGKIVEGAEFTIKPELKIYYGDKQESINGLSKRELWWLGQELSDFLNLELQVIYPTPKLPQLRKVDR